MTTQNNLTGQPAAGGADATDTPAAALDPAKLRTELSQMNREMFEDFSGRLMENVNATLEGIKAARAPTTADVNKTVTESLSEFKDEIETIGIDESQGAAMLKMMEKVLTRNAKSFKEDIITTVDSRNTVKSRVEKKAEEIAQLYPDIKTRGTPLHKEASKIYNDEMTDAERASPLAQYHAAMEAADRLGIEPIKKIPSILADDENPTGSGPGTKGKKKVEEIDLGMASFFNVDPKKVNEKLKQISRS